MEPILSVRSLCFAAGEQQILKNLSLDVWQDDWISISGPSGSGKSTLLKLIATLLEPTSGQLRYRGADVLTMEPTQYRRKVSYCFQNPLLFGKTVEDNLSFPSWIRNEPWDRAESLRMMKEIGLAESLLTKDISGLSGGEKQRIALIRNVLYMPDILLLDEITSSLDEENSALIWNWLNKRKEENDISFLVVTHEEEEAQRGNRRIWLHKGEKVREETRSR